MIREITLGQYYQTESLIHDLDPRCKLIVTFAYIVSLFVFTNPYIYILAFLFLVMVVALSHVPVKYIMRGMKTILVLLLVTVIFNMFMIKGTVLISFWKLSITAEGVQNAVYMAVRLILLIFGSSILTFTTTPSRLTDGLESVFKPLKIFKVPVHEMAMMMSIALRFIPILVDETDKIMKAQLSRCADFESGNLIKRAKSLIPILIPLFVSAFRRANDLAMAMEARCYRGGQGRTKMKPLRYHKTDAAAYLVTVAYLVGIVLLGIYADMLPYGNGFVL